MVLADATLPGILKLLADPTRLRILALLEREELAVGELSKALGMAQSRVSNHLRLLREADILRERHAGASTYLSLANHAVEGPAERLWSALRGELDGLPEHEADLIRLEAVRAERRDKTGGFFDRIAGDWDKIAGAFETGQGRQRAAVQLLPDPFVAADLGCGTGYMAEALLGQVSHLICVDRSERMIEEARKRLDRATSRTRVEFRCGDLDRLPIEEGEVDGVVAGMVLHHMLDADSAIREMHRILRPGGVAAVLEMAPHKELWMREELGDRHLGLEASDVLAAFQRVGFVDARMEPVTDRYQPPTPGGEMVSLPLYIVRGRKPVAETRTQS